MMTVRLGSFIAPSWFLLFIVSMFYARAIITDINYGVTAFRLMNPMSSSLQERIRMFNPSVSSYHSSCRNEQQTNSRKSNPTISFISSKVYGNQLYRRHPKSTARNLVPDPNLFDFTTSTTIANVIPTVSSIMESSSMTVANAITTMEKETAEALAGPFFGLSLFPYLAFIYFLNVDENQTPKGVVVGFAACLLFVFLTIPAAIAAKLLYDVSLADSDWLHGSAESMLTITNLVTVIPFRQALNAKQQQIVVASTSDAIGLESVAVPMPKTAMEYGPMVSLLGLLTIFAVGTAIVPAINNPQVHTPYLNGFLDLPYNFMVTYGANTEPENALTIGTWIIHISSLVEFLIAMGFCWRWADIVQNPKWKGLTWGLLPLHTSGIVACVSHLFYNSIAILVPLQALLTCIGNTSAAYAAYRIAISNGWKFSIPTDLQEKLSVLPVLATATSTTTTDVVDNESPDESTASTPLVPGRKVEERKSLVGFEDLGDVLANDNDYTFLIKLFVGCGIASYIIKYGELFIDVFPTSDGTTTVPLALSFIVVPTLLNAYKWYRRSQDPKFEGWF